MSHDRNPTHESTSKLSQSRTYYNTSSVQRTLTRLANHAWSLVLVVSSKQIGCKSHDRIPTYESRMPACYVKIKVYSDASSVQHIRVQSYTLDWQEEEDSLDWQGEEDRVVQMSSTGTIKTLSIAHNNHSRLPLTLPHDEIS